MKEIKRTIKPGSENWAKTTVKDQAMPNGYDMTLGSLKESLDKMIERGVPLDTPVAIDQIENVYFDTGGWKLVDYLWESWPMQLPFLDTKFDPDLVEEEDYSAGIFAFQAFVTRDLNGDRLVVITPHY